MLLGSAKAAQGLQIHSSSAASEPRGFACFLKPSVTEKRSRQASCLKRRIGLMQQPPVDPGRLRDASGESERPQRTTYVFPGQGHVVFHPVMLPETRAWSVTTAPCRPSPARKRSELYPSQHIRPVLIRLSPECLDFSIESLKLDEPRSLSDTGAKRQ